MSRCYKCSNGNFRKKKLEPGHVRVAEFLNFFPAYDLEKVLKMKVSNFNLLYNSMVALKAKTSIQDCRNLDYSKATNSSRGKFMRKMNELAFPWQHENTVSSKELVEMMGNG